MNAVVVTAVLNEEEAIDRLLSALSHQTRRPDLLAIADGGSTDGTLEKIALRAPSLPFAVKVFSVPGKIATGRNAVIANSPCDVIAVTDADCIPVPEWLESLLAPIEAGTAVAVAGNYYADTRTSLERAIATFTWVPATEKTRRFLPSHRSVAYLRTVWQSLGGYNDTIDSGEDTSFDLEIEKKFPYAIAPAAKVAWRPRSTIKKALWQQVFYGAGDGQARIQLGYHAAIASLVLCELLAITGPDMLRFLSVGVIAMAAAYFVAKHWRLFKRVVPDVLYVTALTLLLPPARLLGFSVGLSGGSVRKILNRS